MGSGLHPVERDLAVRTLAAVRSALGTEESELAWKESSSLSLDEAVEYALASID